ncbi:unnamed protein product [Meganyctiphanes norvegica]|uniref:Xylose isomerase n=1 Tax=Meganyctiphanes norvegica TaxID=48144 RepID=A0AAV2QFP8_MEGNR
MNRFFSNIQPIHYRPDAGPEDTLVFRHYNPGEIIHGKPMLEWFKFAVCNFNTFRYMGGDDYYGDRVHMRHRDWEDHHMDRSGSGGQNNSYHGWGGYMFGGEGDGKSIESYKQRMRASFEFYHKLGVKFYTASDRDFAPDCDNWEETNRFLEEMTSMACDLQKQVGVRPLYFSADLFTHPRYMNGAAASPDANIFAYACAQVKRAMDMAKRLNAENFVFFNPRDGYQHTYMRHMFRDMSHMANMYRMALQYKDKIGFRGQLLIQPKPMDPRRHQYESDAMATMHLLRYFGLDRRYKLYIKPAWSCIMSRRYEHDVYMSSAYNMLGMVGASDSYMEINATSDIHARDVRHSTHVMKCVMEQGGLYQGGFVLDGRCRRESWEPRDLFHGHVLTMDTYARALKNAARMVSDAVFAKNLQQRYITYKTGFGERMDKGNTNFEECEAHIRKHGEPQQHSARYEHFDQMFNFYIYPQSAPRR